MANNKTNNAQTLIDHIRTRIENPVIIPNSELMKLLGMGNDVYQYQKLRYEIPFLTSDIILERQPSSHLRQEKQPFGFKKLTPEEAEHYNLTAINFRYLTEAQINEIRNVLPEGMSNKDIFRILLIVDILFSKNPKNQWCTIAKNLFPSFLAASEDEIQMLFDLLIDKKILYKAKLNDITIFKLALSDKERQEIEAFLNSDNMESLQELDIVNVSITRTRPVSLERKTRKNIKASDAIDLSKKCAIISNKETNVREDLKTTDFDDILKILAERYSALEKRLNTIEKDNAKSHEVFNTMNEDYIAKTEELETLKTQTSELTAAKQRLKQSIPHTLNQMPSRLLDSLMEYTKSPVSAESTGEFKSNVLSIIADSQQSLKNLLPK